MSVSTANERIIQAFDRMYQNIKVIQGNMEAMIKRAYDSEVKTSAYISIPAKENTVLIEQIVRLISTFPLSVETRYLMKYLLKVAKFGRTFARNIAKQSRFRRKSTVEEFKDLFFDMLGELVLMLKIEQQRQLNRKEGALERTANSIGRDVYELGKREIAPNVERQAQHELDTLTAQQNAQQKAGDAGGNAK
jgi:hypothetical protein